MEKNKYNFYRIEDEGDTSLTLGVMKLSTKEDKSEHIGLFVKDYIENTDENDYGTPVLLDLSEAKALINVLNHLVYGEPLKLK